jgi:hypothetical protein
MAPIEVPITQSGSMPGLVQRLVNSALIGAERAAALKDQHHLARKFGRFHNGFYGLMKDIIHEYLSAHRGRGSAIKTVPSICMFGRRRTTS